MDNPYYANRLSGTGYGCVANGVSLGSAKVDENGDPIYTSAGENTHLILEWGEGGTLSVRATVRPWGVVEEDIPMH